MKIHRLARPPKLFCQTIFNAVPFGSYLPGLSANGQDGNETPVLAISYQTDYTAYADISISAGKGNGN